MGKKSAKSTARTTAISPRSSTSHLSRFSSFATSTSPRLYYAHVLRAPDAHTLRIYDVLNGAGKCISRWSSTLASPSSVDDQAGADGEEGRNRVGAIEWVNLSTSVDTLLNGVEQSNEKRGKKRRKSSDSNSTLERMNDESSSSSSSSSSKPMKLYLCMGQQSGSILVFSYDGSSSFVLSHPSVKSPITSMTTFVEGNVAHLWTAHQDGLLRVWDLTKRSLLARTTLIGDSITSWDSLAVTYTPPSIIEEEEESAGKRTIRLILSSSSLHVYQFSLGAQKKDKIKELKPTYLGKCTGHVDVAHLEWLPLKSTTLEDSSMQIDSTTTTSSSSSSSDISEQELLFMSYSNSDRFVQLWSLVPQPGTKVEGVLKARFGLDSPVISIACSRTHLAAIDQEGKLSLASIPSLTTTTTTSSTTKVQALEIRSEIIGVPIANAEFGKEEGVLIICRAGVKPIFERIEFLNEGREMIEKIELNKLVGGVLGVVNNGEDEQVAGPQLARYHESNGTSTRSGLATTQESTKEEDSEEESGQLDVDLAEPTLAERLKSLNVNRIGGGRGTTTTTKEDNGRDHFNDSASSSSSEDGSDDSSDDDDDEEEQGIDRKLAVPSTTLTTTLIQALHSTDAPLLESCLVHSKPSLIRATIQRLPSGSLVLNLLEALVERLAIGKAGRTTSVASVKRAKGLIEWVKQVLIIHVGFLVTIPSLVNRLSSLHASLTSRLRIQPTLFALQGRLDLVISQIDQRRQKIQRVNSGLEKRGSGGKTYVEGQSDDEEDEDEEEGSVEDVMLGNDDDDDEEEGDEERSEAGEAGLEMLDLEASEEDEGEFDDDDEDEEDEEEDDQDEDDDEDDEESD